MSDQKYIVVTGGTKGIGRAIIEIFSKNRFNVITCSRNEDELAKLKKEIESSFHNNLSYLKADLSDREDTRKFVAFVNQKANHVEVLINNTGRFLPGQVHNEEEGVLEDLINTNLYSAYHVTRGLVKPMIELKRGHIFNICSTASVMAYINGGSYAISKHAMLGMSKVLREELKEHDIRVTSVMPGATYTASWEGADIPEDRFMKSSDVAEMIWATYKLSGRTVVEELLIRPQLGDL